MNISPCITTRFLTGEYDLKVNQVAQIKDQAVVSVRTWRTWRKEVSIYGFRVNQWEDLIYTTLVEAYETSTRKEEGG